MTGKGRIDDQPRSDSKPNCLFLHELHSQPKYGQLLKKPACTRKQFGSHCLMNRCSKAKVYGQTKRWLMVTCAWAGSHSSQTRQEFGPHCLTNIDLPVEAQRQKYCHIKRWTVLPEPTDIGQEREGFEAYCLTNRYYPSSKVEVHSSWAGSR